MASNGVGMEIAAVDLEVEPVEAEGLCEAQCSFAVVCVYAVSGGLIEQCDDAEAEDERDKSYDMSTLHFAQR